MVFASKHLKFSKPFWFKNTLSATSKQYNIFVVAFEKAV